tara:strand:+ start:5806 stop:7491 length:1686 start_codon:yes stop_codon:yes gene_type:complete
MNSQFDVIIIGSGISGGWAAKEFCEKGFKTLVIERGRQVKHLEDYTTAMMHPWEFEMGGKTPDPIKEENPVVSRCYAFNETTAHFFAKDKDYPYQQSKPFDWIRAYQVGGKSLLWARQVQRWSDTEFTSPKRDEYASDWPIRYKNIAPWYSHVEKFIGVSGNLDGLEEVPDGEFLKPWEMNAMEKYLQKKIQTHFPERTPVIGRCAHLTEMTDTFTAQGRNQCQARTLCERGCPFGAYFSSNASTLPWAEKTGNLTLLTDTLVESLDYDTKSKKAKGVKTVNRFTKQRQQFSARCVFVNAATINSNVILMNSVSERFPNGLGNDSGRLGKYLAFHNYRGNITAKFKGLQNSYYYGRRPTAIMMPSYRNVKKQDMPFKGGYMVFYSAVREGWTKQVEGVQFGKEYRKKIEKPGQWSVNMMMQGETVPIAQNQVRLSKQKDQFGIPQADLDVSYTENDELMLSDFLSEGKAMLEKGGCEQINVYDTKQAPGLDIHEMGGVAMGEDPNTSLLNAFNQMHLCTNVFVTDGACMTSTGTKNPSLTFMALTARAAHYAMEQLKENKI